MIYSLRSKRHELANIEGGDVGVGRGRAGSPCAKLEEGQEVLVAHLRRLAHLCGRLGRQGGLKLGRVDQGGLRLGLELVKVGQRVLLRVWPPARSFELISHTICKRHVLERVDIPVDARPKQLAALVDAREIGPALQEAHL